MPMFKVHIQDQSIVRMDFVFGKNIFQIEKFISEFYYLKRGKHNILKTERKKKQMKSSRFKREENN